MNIKNSLQVKEGVLLSPHHFKYHRGRIIAALHDHWPDNYPVIITRGYENCEGGKDQSKHLPPFFAAFDFRTRHLPRSIDRNNLLSQTMEDLGPDYYGYYKIYWVDKDGVEVPEDFEGKKYPVEWVHIQIRNPLPCY